MGSIAARAVAQEVLETLGRGEKPSLRKIARKKGYSPKTADTPSNITNTESYKAVMRPLVERLEAERDAIIANLEAKRDRAQYHHLIDGLDKVTKNIQLLTGGATDQVKVVTVVKFANGDSTTA